MSMEPEGVPETNSEDWCANCSDFHDDAVSSGRIGYGPKFCSENCKSIYEAELKELAGT